MNAIKRFIEWLGQRLRKLVIPAICVLCLAQSAQAGDPAQELLRRRRIDYYRKLDAELASIQRQLLGRSGSPAVAFEDYVPRRPVNPYRPGVSPVYYPPPVLYPAGHCR